MRVFITGIGIISPLGHGISPTIESIVRSQKGITPLSLFPTTSHMPLPVGEIQGSFSTSEVPRTHALARLAAQEAMANATEPPEAIVIGVTTGGMPTTENLIRQGNHQPELYRYHALSSVAEYLAREMHCQGPVLTVSTACSSGAVALKIALDLLRCGKARRVLAGGADALCRLTYYGFHALQLIDPSGAHPLDKNRQGMSVAEGAAMLLLTVSEAPPADSLAEILGVGLTCDAYHPAAPHPDGLGALNSMQEALREAKIPPAAIDYVNLHGTGTVDNDLAEAKALHALFGAQKPPLSSTKGAFGHALAASGAIEAAVCTLCIAEGLIPANVGCELVDAALKLEPVIKPYAARVQTVLSNSFGFGGNNASVVLSDGKSSGRDEALRKSSRFAVLGTACLTGAGDTEQTLEHIGAGKGCYGLLDIAAISKNLPPREVRRLRRLPRMALSLAQAAHTNSGQSPGPSSVFFGTAWGALSETYEFLKKLFESDEQFSSPTDFIGSVHNAPAGQVSIRFESRGPNITNTCGDYSFEQALFTASLLSHKTEKPLMVIGADEYHEPLSGILDGSVALSARPSDGGGALLLRPVDCTSGLSIYPAFFEYAHQNECVISSLIRHLGGKSRISELFGAIFAGIPAQFRKTGEAQLAEFVTATGFNRSVIDYRPLLGEFASASAVAAVLALEFTRNAALPVQLSGVRFVHSLDKRGILLLNLGPYVTALEVLP